MILALATRAMNTPLNTRAAPALQSWTHNRVPFRLPEFEALQEDNFLEMNFTDLVEFFVMQLSYESLEECYERFVYREPYGLATSTPRSNACGSRQ